MFCQAMSNTSKRDGGVYGKTFFEKLNEILWALSFNCHPLVYPLSSICLATAAHQSQAFRKNGNCTTQVGPDINRFSKIAPALFCYLLTTYTTLHNSSDKCIVYIPINSTQHIAFSCMAVLYFFCGVQTDMDYTFFVSRFFGIRERQRTRRSYPLKMFRLSSDVHAMTGL